MFFAGLCTEAPLWVMLLRCPLVFTVLVTHVPEGVIAQGSSTQVRCRSAERREMTMNKLEEVKSGAQRVLLATGPVTFDSPRAGSLAGRLIKVRLTSSQEKMIGEARAPCNSGEVG